MTPSSPGTAPPALVFTDVELEGRRGQTVVAVGGVVTFVGGGGEAHGEVLRHRRDDTVVTVEGRGGALLPGLHDHHLHLFSLAARDGSVDCGRPAVLDRAGLGQALRTAAAGCPPGQWVRGYGYDESTTGALDAAGLDQLLGGLRGTPVRIQHRSGHQWVLNTAGVAAVRRVAGADRSPVPDRLMSPDGVFSDVDGALRPLWSAVQGPELGGAGTRLARFGVTGVTDATVTNGVAEVELVAAEQRRGALGQRVLMLGDGLPARSGSMLCTGARKLVLIDTELPSLDELTAAIIAAGARGVALHCVSRQSLVLAAVALREAGGGPHRIEHASVAPPEAMALLRGLPVTVVTQPGFIAQHGDRYRREVEPSDRAWLYRLRGWTMVGVPLAGSTDAPFGDPDPWAAMRAAVSRRTAGGAVMGGGERLSEEQALGLFLSPLDDPGGPPRRVAVGARADLCLLSASWLEARHRLDRHLVRATFVGGRAIWADEAGGPPSGPPFDGSRGRQQDSMRGQRTGGSTQWPDRRRHGGESMTATTNSTGTASGEQRMLIDGKLVEATSGKLFDNVNPATEAVLGQVADAGHEDVEEAIGAARRAFDESDWSTDRQLRQRCLRQLQAALEEEQELLRAELVAEVGTPVLLTYGPQLDAPLAEGFRWPTDFIDEFQWERDIPEGRAFGTRSWRKVTKEPVGVVAAIVPWNYPFEVTVNKLGPALATGNTVILKAAPNTPWNATRIGRLVAERTDFPPGVLQVVTTSDNAVAEDLVTDPRVDLISFTGSTAIGRRIMEKGAPTLKRLFLELGGKSADIILDDADFGAKLSMAWTVCVHGGQGCVMLTRMLLPRSRYDEGIALIEAGFQNVPYGDPTDPGNLQGPQISALQRERVLGYIEKGVAEGARLVAGGGRPPQFDKGFYVEPTLFADVDNSMSIAQEEIFGPVLVVVPFDDDDDAVRLANDSHYGLGVGVTSGSEERALAVARRVRAGTVAVNGGVWYGADAPFGGYKASGIGRQNGPEGFEQYTETKTYAGGLPPLTE